MFAILLSWHSEFCIVGPKWWTEYECSQNICVPSPPLLACQPDIIICGLLFAPFMWCVVLCQLLVSAFVTSSRLNRSGTNFESVQVFVCVMPLMLVIENMDNFGALRLIDDSGFDMKLSLLSFSVSHQVDQCRAKIPGILMTSLLVMFGIYLVIPLKSSSKVTTSHPPAVVSFQRFQMIALPATLPPNLLLFSRMRVSTFVKFIWMKKSNYNLFQETY